MARIHGTSASETILGTPDDDVIFGGNGADTIYGFGGNDYIDPQSEGGGGAKMYGGLGDDTYIIHWAFQKNLGILPDSAIEAAGEGFDTAKLLRSWILGENSEVEWIEPVNLSAKTIAYIQGNGFGQTIIGDAGNNEIYGFGGDDVLIGASGADTLVGGLGNDTYHIDNVGDHAIDSAGEWDRVYTSVSYTLDGNTGVEFLAAESQTGTAAISLTGNNFAQTVVGNAGSNILYGGGGDDVLTGLTGNDVLVGDAGADVLQGGLGDDTYYVLDSADTVLESAGQGYDRVVAGVSTFLNANADVELLEAVNVEAIDRMDLGGSDTANRINGNNGMNILYGNGGSDILEGYGGDDFLVGGQAGKAESDVMVGGAGNDTYYVFSSDDVVIELQLEGLDRVATKVSYSLSFDADVERLEAGDTGASTMLTLSGSNSGNVIIGNVGNNIIDGKGGNDTLSGLAGADIFRFSSALAGGNIDVIDDFETGQDRIGLDDAIYSAFNPGSLDPAYFRLGFAGQDADDYIVYDLSSGSLYFDPDGSSGAGQAIQFATLAGVPALTAADFIIV